MRFVARMLVRPKAEVRDPQGEAVLAALRSLGHDVAEVRPDLVGDLGPGEAPGALTPGGIIGQEHAVGLHVGSAPRRVDDDAVHLRGLEDLDGALGERDGEIVLARMRVERATTCLLRRRHDLRAVLCQHARRRAVL